MELCSGSFYIVKIGENENNGDKLCLIIRYKYR